MPELIYSYLGKSIPLEVTTPETYKVSRKQHKQLSPDRIVGIDTESIIYNTILKFKYLQLYANEHSILLDKEQTEEEILEFLFNWLIERYGTPFVYPSDISERSKETRKTRKNGKKDGRDGRKQYIPPVVLTFFNLQYDLGRMIDENSLFRRIIGFGSDSFKFQYKHFSVEIIYSCIGVACPSFKWLVVDHDKRVAITIIGFDGTSFFKSSLSEVTRQLKLTAKIDLEEDKDLFSRDWYFNPPTTDQIARFEEYSLNDAKCHKEIYDILAILLSRIDAQIFDKTGVIPLSAPSASARIMMHLCEEEEFKAPTLPVQQIGLDAYKGAISFCVKPGYCTNITVKDISSAYPHVMSLLPDFSTVQYKQLAPLSGNRLEHTINEWSLMYKEHNPLFGVVIADYECLDALYPVSVTYADGKQIGIYGKCYRNPITIPELIIGYNSGRLKVTRIYDGYILIGSNQSSPLKKFIDLCYKLKSENGKDEPMYLLAKLLMNSLYGKLIEKRHTVHIVQNYSEDHLLELPYVENKAYKKAVLQSYLQDGADNAIDLATSLACNEYKGRWKDYILLSDFLSSERWSTGYYFNAIYAAQITGFTRAKLMLAASYTHALAGDTDSIFIPDGNDNGLIEYLNEIGAITPNDGLGSFETELEHASGLILKKKQYYLETDKKLKEAHHAIQSVSGKKYETKEIKTSVAMKLQIKEYLQQLYERGEITYETKEKPISLKDGIRNNRVLGKFIKRDIKIIYKQHSDYQLLLDGKVYWKHVIVHNMQVKELK